MRTSQTIPLDNFYRGIIGFSPRAGALPLNLYHDEDPVAHMNAKVGDAPRAMGIGQHPGSAHTSVRQGIVERAHQTLRATYLKTQETLQKPDTSTSQAQDIVDTVCIPLNNAPLIKSGCPPDKILFGREISLFEKGFLDADLSNL